jgi:hypothetical protein
LSSPGRGRRHPKRAGSDETAAARHDAVRRVLAELPAVQVLVTRSGKPSVHEGSTLTALLTQLSLDIDAEDAVLSENDVAPGRRFVSGRRSNG